MSDPALAAGVRETLVAQLMEARRAISSAIRCRDEQALRDARKAVDRAKRALGERGPGWWADGAPDLNRRMARNTLYAEWYASLQTP